MKTILIPFDSSTTSKNTIEYVTGLLSQLSVEKVFIVQSYELSLFQEMSDTPSEERVLMENNLKEISETLQKKAGDATQVKYVISEFSLNRCIHQAINNLEPDLLIAGSDSEDEGSPIGDEIINIAKSSPVPVLVIPSGCKYQPVRTALLPCNFGDFSNLVLLEGLNVLQPVNLQLLNVDPNNSFAEQRAEIEQNITQLLSEYKHSFHYSDHPDVVEGILEFAEEKDIELIIALPGKHSFFYRLTHGSITQALTQNSNRPVLLLKDIED